jgi:hypothetical protein
VAALALATAVGSGVVTRVVVAFVLARRPRSSC